MYLGDLEYIYKNDGNQKKDIGTIKGIELQTVIYFTLTIHKQNYWCILHKPCGNWKIEIPTNTKNINVELSYLDDAFWNSERLIEELDDHEAGIAIAYAIKELYKQRRGIFI